MLNKIHSNNIHFNNTEKQIFQYILNNFKEIPKLKLFELSKKTFVSPNTIVRFCKKLGFKGFADLKFYILEEIYKSNLDEIIKKNKDYSSDIISNLNKNISINSNEVFNKISEMLLTKKKIYLFGFGLSSFSIKSFAKKLELFKIISIIPQDRDSALMIAESLESDDIAFFISLSGETKNIIDPLIIAKTKNCKAISITKLGQNSIADLCNINLYSYISELLVNKNDCTSRIGIDFLLDNIIYQLTCK